MKKFKDTLLALVFCAIGFLFSQNAFAEPEFCWRDSYGRGAGSVLNECPDGKEKIGALCYSACPAGMKRVGFDCHSVCPDGMRDDGLYCRKEEYGRGGGYAWRFTDPPNNSGMFRRCEADHGKGNCQKNGAIVYPKCKPGYRAFGCCICRPDPPNCGQLGLGGRLDLSCHKKIVVGNPTPMSCSSNKQQDAGLCYSQCNPGYAGVGPVCWGKPPNNWVECGMGAAKDSATCANIIMNQVATVGAMAFDISALVLTAGASGTTQAGNAAAKAAHLASLRAKYAKMVKAFKESTRELERLGKAEKIAQIPELASLPAEDRVTEEDIVRIAAEIASIVDPTGVSDTVAAYTYPKCSKYYPEKPIEIKVNEFQIKSSAGKCLDVHSPDQNKNGGRVQVWDCNGTPAQAWKIDGGSIKSSAGKCLDADNAANRVIGSKVQVWDCNSSLAQTWFFLPNQRVLKNGNGMCLDVDSPNQNNNGAKVQLWQCLDLPAQKWSIELR